MINDYAVGRWLTALLTVFAVSTMPVALAQPDENTLTLRQAIEKTVDAYPSLQRFDMLHRQQAMAADIAALKPGYSVDVELENALGSRQFQGVDSADLTIALSSVIELGGKREARTSLAQARAQITATRQRVMTLDVLGKLVADYIAVLSTQEDLTLKREARQISADMLRSVQNRFDNGAASEAELMLARARLSQAEIALDQVSAELERGRISLSLYWGEASPSFINLAGDFLQFAPLRPIDDLLVQLRESPALVIYADRVRIQEAELSLQASQSRQDVAWQFGLRHLAGSNDTAMMAGVSIPLFVAQRNQARVERERLDQQLVVIEREQAFLDMQSRLMRAYSLYQQAVAAATRMRADVIPDLKRALVVTRDGYEQGLLRYQELIIAEQELLDARAALINQATQAHQSLALIEQLTGMTLRMTPATTPTASAQ
ncbi:TolC family protein [Pseudohongiella nitratireducens]|uniref:TolC family protein n=1 Tax=Pseudohongiella nitratireducens TaxID=1768907 RepID=UPI0030ED34D9|tara:strand:- start:1440 stop:2741 length:1302 start_codon:yes stop_codon:yes gene_type:complete